ncbi:hypothetical protein BDV3_001289 [Batrachochytrium dendrobatidis]
MPTLRRNIIKAIGLMPVLFLLFLIAWSWYAFVVRLSFTSLTASIAVLLLFYHIQLALFMSSFYLSVVTCPGSPSKTRTWTQPHGLDSVMPPLMPIYTSLDSSNCPGSAAEDLELGQISTTEYTAIEVKKNGQRRFCSKCNLLKPDRCHHCSACERCILKMDHHSSMSMIWPPFAVQSRMELFLDVHVLLVVFAAGLFAICLLIFMVVHGYYLACNRTTIEMLESNRAVRLGDEIIQIPHNVNIYSLGASLNFKQVFGNQPWKWLLPFPSSIGDGYTFPISQVRLSRLK